MQVIVRPVIYCLVVGVKIKKIRNLPLYKEKLKIENVDGIDEILLSDEWKHFADLLTKNPVKTAPKTCWKYCGKGKGFEIRSQEVYKQLYE